MVDFARVITDEDKAFLASNREDLLETAQGREKGREIWQNRVKKASEAHVELKALHTEYDEVDETFPDWQTFRDNFILDWIANRTIVTEEEAEMIFETTADEALAVIETAEQNDSPRTISVLVASSTSVEPGVVLTAVDAEPAVAVAPKRRGRPPGAGKKAVVVKAAAKKSSTKKKVAAKKSSGGSASAKAQVLIEKYASRDWSRKDIILKLQSQLDMGAAYASTLYQKFA